MIILGLDIGYDRCGVCVYDSENGILESCLITTNKKDSIALRLKTLREDLNHLKQKYNPNSVGIERLFFNRKNTVFEKICMSKGIALELFADCNINEIEPKKIKKELIGSGDASKQDVKNILSKLLKVDLEHYIDDVVDAIAIAVYMNQKNKLENMYNKKQ